MFSKKKLFKINNKILSFFISVINSLAYFFSLKLPKNYMVLVMKIEWARDPSPEWMDHDQDYFYQSRSIGKTFF